MADGAAADESQLCVMTERGRMETSLLPPPPPKVPPLGWNPSHRLFGNRDGRVKGRMGRGIEESLAVLLFLPTWFIHFPAGCEQTPWLLGPWFPVHGFHGCRDYGVLAILGR